MDEIIVNRVINSGLVSLDLEDFYHSGERVIYDFKDNLFMGMILKEKDFREFLKVHDFTQYQDKNVAIICSEDAIIPTWAYMLLALHFEPYVHMVVLGNIDVLEQKLYDKIFQSLDMSLYTGARVVVKGCGHKYIPNAVYVDISTKLKPVVKSLMFGEPCSTVPLFKNKTNA